jgi:hypothetical protein
MGSFLHNIAAVTVKAGHKFSFDALCEGKLGLTRAAGASLCESADFCLSKNNHPNPVTLNITGDSETSGMLEWSRPDEKAAERTYGNRIEAVEDGAYAVAIVVVTQLEHFPGVAKSPIGTGMDYWITGDDPAEIFLARLEVSGIFKDSSGQISSRLQTKLEQTKASDDTKLPAYAAIVEFGSPEIRVCRRDAEGIA